MREEQSFLSAVMGELSRRKVLRTLGAYAVGVFVILQLMDAAVEPLRLPEWFPTLVVITLILGFPIVFVLAWQFDMTGQGIKRTRTRGLLTRSQSFTLFTSMFLATGAMGLAFYQYYSGVFVAQPGAQEVVEAAPRSFQAPENSIAVLPFADLSEGGDQAHFSDGMAEEILNLLAQVDGLNVAARTSSFAFRNPQKDIREIGRALNVSTVLEGSIRTSGDQIRLTAQLINVEDGYHIWSQNYDRELKDLFALQDEVASSIATALVDSFKGLAVNQNPGARTTNLQAFEAYRTGRLHWWRRSPQELQKAIALFATALEHDPLYAPAYAGIADSWILLSLYGDLDRMKAIERAHPMIEKALALDPESAEAFAALGLARMQIAQRDSSESALRQAIRLNEDYIPAHLWLANLLGEQGRIPEQGLVLQQAMAKDPLNELLAVNYSGNLYSQGDYDGARDLLSGLIMIKPDSARLLGTIAKIAIGHGELVEGWEFAHRAYDLEPENPTVIQTMAMAWMELGGMDETEELLRNALELAAENSDLQSTWFTFLLINGRLEEAEQVVKSLFGSDINGLPENFQRYYHFQIGLLRLIGGDHPAARDELEQAIDHDELGSYKGDNLFALTTTAFLNRSLGNEDLALERLAQAEKAINRARINGIDEPELYYSESSIQVMRGEHQAALESLRTAYEKGWRQGWVLDIDGRLDPLRQMPEFLELQQLINDDVDRALSEVRSQQVALN
jgi:TolB-like protein/Flp pilus assembly protein TadD